MFCTESERESLHLWIGFVNPRPGDSEALAVLFYFRCWWQFVFLFCLRLQDFPQCDRYSPKKKLTTQRNRSVNNRSCTFSPHLHCISTHHGQVMHTNTWQKSLRTWSWKLGTISTVTHGQKIAVRSSSRATAAVTFLQLKCRFLVCTEEWWWFTYNYSLKMKF